MKKKYDYEYIKQYFEDNGCKLLSTEYHGCDQKLDYICSCGKQSQISFYNFKRGQRCYECRNKKIGEGFRLSAEYVKQYFEDQSCKLLSEYHTANQKLDYICSCGNKSKITFAKFKAGQRCKDCGLIKVIGENNHNWKANLTSEDRERRRHRELIPGYSTWKKQVKKRDNFTCKCCHKPDGALEVHHYYPYSKYPEYRTLIENGITLCEDCHGEYHHRFGKDNNSKPEFFLFIMEQRLGIVEESEIAAAKEDPEIKTILERILNDKLES